ncbi:MAG TPA: PilZ domain-containing protein [Elusimicrobiota bacterium]|nr:PilZ domain-containing protein [Elusimicrobiota bacterium]
MISDQRHHHRVSFFVGAGVSSNLEGSDSVRAVIRDISVSGLRIETLAKFEEGRTVYLDFNVAGRFQFTKMPAVVKRVYRHGGGFLLGLMMQDGTDRRRVRQALTYVMENAL